MTTTNFYDMTSNSPFVDYLTTGLHLTVTGLPNLTACTIRKEISPRY